MPAPSPITNPSDPCRRAAGAGRLVVARRKRTHGKNPPTDKGVTAASEPPAIITSASPCRIMRTESPIELAEVAQAVARGRNRSLGPVADADLAGRHVHNDRRNEKRRNLARPALQSGSSVRCNNLETADAGADEDTTAVGDFIGDLQARLLNRFWTPRCPK